MGLRENLPFSFSLPFNKRTAGPAPSSNTLSVEEGWAWECGLRDKGVCVQSPALPPTTQATGRVPVPLCERPLPSPPSSTHLTGSGNFMHRKHRARHVVLALFCFKISFTWKREKEWGGIQRQRERDRIPSRPVALCGAGHGARSHDPDVTT